MFCKLQRLIIAALVIFNINYCFSQKGISHELGVIVGPVAFQSDFGERGDFDTNSGNVGIGVGLIHYINFSYGSECDCYTSYTYFNDHFKIRSELSWNKTDLDHFGKWVDASRSSDNAERLRRHSGEANNIDIGAQLEYYPFSIRDFQAGYDSFAPFVSFGAHFTFATPKASTTYGDGDITNPTNFHSAWEPGSIDDKDHTVWSLVGSVGTRYKLSDRSDLILDLRWQYYFDNKVDGLDHQLRSNEVNDWLVWLNFGYIHYLN